MELWPGYPHILHTKQFSDFDVLEAIFQEADRMKGLGRTNLAQDKTLLCLFFEPSTRTRFSFERAMRNLGGASIATENAGVFSSFAKGESIEDTARVCSDYCDVMVLRHPEDGAAERAARVASVPVINAGDGSNQHPTQALLDIYTIKRELGRISSLRIGFMGDLKKGRTVRSLAYLLAKIGGNKLFFISPKELALGEDIRGWLGKKTEIIETEEIGVASELDVLYVTRLQKERHAAGAEFERYSNYRVDARVLDVLPKDAIIMHPLPRNTEIPAEVDADPRAAYFRQAQNGLYVRMALLKMIMSPRFSTPAPTFTEKILHASAGI